MWPVDGVFVLLGVITWLYRDTASACMASGIRCCWPGCLELTVMICVIRRLALTVSDVCLRLICSQSTSTYSALEVSHFMRYTNLRLTPLVGFSCKTLHKVTARPLQQCFVCCADWCIQRFYGIHWLQFRICRLQFWL